jgi:hypothetical protein
VRSSSYPRPASPGPHSHTRPRLRRLDIMQTLSLLRDVRLQYMVPVMIYSGLRCAHARQPILPSAVPLSSPRARSQGFIFGQFRESTCPARAAVEGADCSPRRRQPS